MNARFQNPLGRLSLVAVLLASAGCGSGGGGSSGMSIVACSLQCNDSAIIPGAQVSCGVTNVSVNQEIRLTFTAPIDPNTVTNNSFRLIEVNTGKTPAGSFALDSNDATTLIYRPQLTFDSAGNPIFGLSQDKSYAFDVPGTLGTAPGPFITNMNGTPNTSRLFCTLHATEPVRDANPGRPRAFVTVDKVTGYDQNGEPDEFDLNVIAQGASNVYRASPVRIVFDDVMNPATLANPVTGKSDFIHAFVDADGDITDRGDQVAMQGSFTVTIDQSAPRTTVIFTPSGGLPSAGSDLQHLRKIVIELSPQISDLGGLGLINAGSVAFTPEQIFFEPIVIDESFVDLSREDSVRTGSNWGAGFLATGPGGGSGRLGDLTVLPGNVVELSTDSEDFSGITNEAIFNPKNVIDRTQPLKVEGGVFEFARLRVDAGGTLRFKGAHPARIYVRGVADVAGVIDLSGGSGTLHRSNSLMGGVAGTAGPNGGVGGRGGNRPDGSRFTGSFQGSPIGGVANPDGTVANVLDAATYTNVNGVAGGGIPYPSTIDPAPVFVGGGQSGLGWPQPNAANPALHMPFDPLDVSGLQLEPQMQCSYPVPSSPGGGGGHALDGVVGDMTFEPRSPMTIPPDSEGGDASLLNTDPLAPMLSPELGLLRGGGGGGGGGAHIQFTAVNGGTFGPMSCAPFPPNPLQIITYLAHSSAGGGGGGGGFQLAAGRRIILSGVINASGGDGGSGTFPPPPTAFNDLAQAGGGGAGGSVLLQPQRVQIQAVPGRINVSGGEGGEGSGNLNLEDEPSTGGNGSPGFLRIETPTPALVENEQAKVNPTESDLQESYGPLVTIEDIFTTAVWTPPVDAPSGWSGAQSCWIRPTGSFFRLVFAEDVPADPACVTACQNAGGTDCDLECRQLGWDLRLRIAGQADPQSFRGKNDVYPGMTIEQVYGTDFGTAPVVVRFQGARAVSVLTDPCSVPETGGSGPIAPNSLTDWLADPAELNAFHADESLSPNIFRFLVLWDRSQPEFAEVEGLEDLTVTIQPD